MAVPDFQSLMLPVLSALKDGEDTVVRKVRDRVVSAEGLNDKDLGEMLPSGRQSTFANRVGWALSYLLRAGLVERVQRGVYRVTDEGKRVMTDPPDRVDIKYLRGFSAFVEGKKEASKEAVERDKTPEEALEDADRELTDALETDVLDRLRKAEPKFLEQAVVALLIAMGYGGGDAARGRVTGKSGDGGIDGIISEDRLGLDEVYIQAKKYENPVGVGHLRNFVGALVGESAQKGVFVTTADFTTGAKDFSAKSTKRIVLVNGEELARLMVRHDVGVRVRDPHRPPILIKAIDEDFFDQG